MSTAVTTDGTRTKLCTGLWPTWPAASKPVAMTASIPSACAVRACLTFETAWKWSIPDARTASLSPNIRGCPPEVVSTFSCARTFGSTPRS